MRYLDFAKSPTIITSKARGSFGGEILYVKLQCCHRKPSSFPVVTIQISRAKKLPLETEPVSRDNNIKPSRLNTHLIIVVFPLCVGNWKFSVFAFVVTFFHLTTTLTFINSYICLSIG